MYFIFETQIAKIENCCAFEHNCFNLILCKHLGGAYLIYDFCDPKYCTTFLNELCFKLLYIFFAHSNLNFKDFLLRGLFIIIFGIQNLHGFAL